MSSVDKLYSMGLSPKHKGRASYMHTRRLLYAVLFIVGGISFLGYMHSSAAILGNNREPVLAPSIAASQHSSWTQRKLLAHLCSSAAVSSAERRVLVTGAAGFIGFHVATALASFGDMVVGFDNFNSYYPVSLKRARQLKLHEMKVDVIDGDLNDNDLVLETFKACRFTHVVHLAGQAGVRYAAKNPFSYVQSNVAATVSLLEAMVSQPNRAALIYASSSSVYGLTEQLPFTETDPVSRPSSLYAATKRSAELLTHVYHHNAGLSVTGLRFFTVYGAWGRPDMSYMAFARNILEGKPIRIFQGPNGTELVRDFTYVGDIVAGVLAAVNTSTPSIKGSAQFRLFNLGNTQPVTVTDFVTTIERYLGRKANIAYQPLPGVGEVLFTHANISAAQSELRYAPKTKLEEGLRHFVKWYLDYYGTDGVKRSPDELNYQPE